MGVSAPGAGNGHCKIQCIGKFFLSAIGNDGIQRLAGDEELRRKLKENGQIMAVSRDWSQIREEILKLYQW